jgi:hypothetical protein
MVFLRNPAEANSGWLKKTAQGEEGNGYLS